MFSKFDAVDQLVKNGVKMTVAFEIVNLTRKERKTYARKRDDLAAKKRNKMFAPCAPWRCKTCGHLIKIKVCFECLREAQKERNKQCSIHSLNQ